MDIGQHIDDIEREYGVMLYAKLEHDLFVPVPQDGVPGKERRFLAANRPAALAHLRQRDPLYGALLRRSVEELHEIAEASGCRVGLRLQTRRVSDSGRNCPLDWCVWCFRRSRQTGDLCWVCRRAFEIVDPLTFALEAASEPESETVEA